MSETASNRMAPPGEIWMCSVCGKTAQDQYGIEGEHSYGWDGSCMLNAVLVRADTIKRTADGISADPFDGEQP